MQKSMINGLYLSLPAAVLPASCCSGNRLWDWVRISGWQAGGFKPGKPASQPDTSDTKPMTGTECGNWHNQGVNNRVAQTLSNSFCSLLFSD